MLAQANKPFIYWPLDKNNLRGRIYKKEHFNFYFRIPNTSTIIYSLMS